METSYIVCPCGKKMRNWQKGLYQVVRRDKEGNIIFAQCYHGHTIINTQKEEQE